MTSTRLIVAAMAIAAAVLVGVVAGFAAGAFDSGTSGPPGSVSQKCYDYGTDRMNEAKLSDPYLKGVIELGFKDGPDAPGGIALLKTIGTTYYMPVPFRDFAFVCVEKGHEDEWSAKLRALDWVEFAHKEGINACQPDCRLGK